MKANKRNLTKCAKQLLGNEWSIGTQAALIAECLTGYIKNPGHKSHNRAAHLERIDSIMRGYGVESMLLDSHGEDMSSSCSMRDVVCDIQYVNQGDTYATTIMYYNGNLVIGCLGNIVERLP
jgi:hypothetical protein